MSTNIARGVHLKSHMTVFSNLPSICEHLVAFSEDVKTVIEETNRLVAEVKEHEDVSKMKVVRHAITEIKWFIVKAYEYIAKINDVPYYFHCEYDDDAQWSTYTKCIKRIEKGKEKLTESLKIYETLQSYCKNAERACNSAAGKLTDEAESARKKKMAARGVGAVAMGAGVAVALSIVAGVFTFGIGTVVELASTAVLATAVGVGSGVAGAVVGEYYNKCSDNFKRMSNNFTHLSRHAVALSELAQEMISESKNLHVRLEHEEAADVLEIIQTEGREIYRKTSVKRKRIYDLKSGFTKIAEEFS